ncbi:UDP-N-acetylmuramate:L-alanyl-gamma-D-glutamyl-meso-diaminopimelate ligase [Anaeromyxobacter diazotrophicus]|uniref:UDP-N-acetylmuramate:L-alanyl-gamma-D-glutamyl-me so-diaminopimelate ligase n=1 Tax=Anaeromyxobacter diazotrophicus TaxID=2590199 RepID=A0A7I9VHL1_9BACT|nr:UDP-N-acetylmuramate:L-alanyl-gamma-D-glutamyl-meso-diaminopimelate ligase [Anaeromyxobacter diazotrophicus]GEJ55871.1 UDP-N-acetylmuramate:L-alanyl-gamma-D-glutamyl-me so-diaminopimelate ligase [Anaeromyxobacter diazotrophicus]
MDYKGVKRIHLIGVAGTGMGSFAGMLKAAGYEVTGSDENVYPPMSTQLERWGIEVMTPYAPGNLDRARPDLVVVGNVVRAVNPEATAMRERGLAHVSFPQALGDLFIAPRHGVVVVGTHGKTTTTAMMGALLHHAGRDPSFLVGGVTRDFESNFRLGAGPHFAVEGDEYDTAYFDKGPKFLHYHPRTAIFTSCELDHADIYRDEAHYESAFERFAELLPADGFLAACAAYESVLRIAKRARCEVETYAVGRPADWEARALELRPDGAHFDLVRGGRTLLRARLAVGGAHNVENALGVAAAATRLGLSPEEIAAGFADFRGVKRRQEVRGVAGGVTVVDDFAHHPTAVAKTLQAIRGTFPEGRILACFEPRSNTSRRNLHQHEYVTAWPCAAEVFILRPAPTDRVPEAERLDVDRLAREISAAGPPAHACASVEEVVAGVVRSARPGDVVVAMSNGAFGGIWDKLLAALGR